MSFNFPNAPTNGQLFTPAGGYQYVYLNGAWQVVQAPQSVGTAQTRNRVVNGAMQISQENASTSSGALTTGNYYAADQWLGSWITVGTTTCLRFGPTSAVSDALRFSVTTATASPAAGSYAQMLQFIEGIRIRDFEWGAVSAKQVVLRFSFFTSVPGTYTAAVKNGAGDRTFLAPFTAAVADVWNTYTIVVPGDVTGTWPTDTSKAMQVCFAFMAGSTYGGGVAGWQAGNKMTMTGSTNGFATVGGLFLITNVGLYLDPNNTGVAPQWQMPDEAEELRACQRYYLQLGDDGSGNPIGMGNATSAAIGHATIQFPVTMRAAPAMTVSAIGDFGVSNASSGTVAPTGINLAGTFTDSYIVQTTGASGLVAGQVMRFYGNNTNAKFKLSARM